MHAVLVNRLGGLSLPRKSVVRLTDRPDMTLDVYRGRKTTVQQCNPDVIQLYTVWRIFVNSINIKSSLNLHLGRKRERERDPD